MQILIAEDDPVAMELLRSALVESGHEVLTAANGREAMSVLRAGSCRIVITDWVMPEMDGLELCQAIRNEELGRYVYVILLTKKEETADQYTHGGLYSLWLRMNETKTTTERELKAAMERLKREEFEEHYPVRRTPSVYV